jgi:hypothetical protein
MKVKELIKELEKCDQDKEIRIWDDERLNYRMIIGIARDWNNKGDYVIADDFLWCDYSKVLL